ncbi:MAG TPA: hypothetical protein VJQ56_11390 [Blastocatellia bacterium]|nr:hypothetical protein [Blastocatellia bacterium]
MKQLSTFMYEVAPGETVTLKVKLQGLGTSMVSVSKRLKRVGSPADLTWNFTVPSERPAEAYNAFVEISFVGAPSGARADLTWQGSNGGGVFSIPPITITSPDKDPGFTFWLE